MTHPGFERGKIKIKKIVSDPMGKVGAGEGQLEDVGHAFGAFASSKPRLA